MDKQAAIFFSEKVEYGTLFHYIEDNEQYPNKHEEPSQYETTYQEH